MTFVKDPQQHMRQLVSNHQQALVTVQEQHGNASYPNQERCWVHADGDRYFLDLMSEHLPLSSMEWEHVERLHRIDFPGED